MKKIITLLFLLCVTSAYSLDFDSTTDKCLRDILDKQTGEITIDDLQEINEFYCYSSEVSIDSFRILIKNLKNKTKISIGREGIEGYTEGLILESKFLSGAILDNDIFLPGIFDKNLFIPGMLDIDKGTFLSGILLESGFVPAIIKNGRLLPGYISDKTFLTGMFDNTGFNSGDFSKEFSNFNDKFKGNNPFGMDRESLFSIGTVNDERSDFSFGNEGTFLGTKGVIKIFKTGMKLTGEALFLASPLLAIPGGSGVIPVAMVGVGGFFTTIGMILCVATIDKITGEEYMPGSEPKDEPKDKPEIETKDEKPEDEDIEDEDTECESPDDFNEGSGDIPNEGPSVKTNDGDIEPGKAPGEETEDSNEDGFAPDYTIDKGFDSLDNYPRITNDFFKYDMQNTTPKTRN